MNGKVTLSKLPLLPPTPAKAMSSTPTLPLRVSGFGNLRGVPKASSTIRGTGAALGHEPDGALNLARPRAVAAEYRQESAYDAARQRIRAACARLQLVSSGTSLPPPCPPSPPTPCAVRSRTRSPPLT